MYIYICIYIYVRMHVSNESLIFAGSAMPRFVHEHPVAVFSPLQTMKPSIKAKNIGLDSG